MGLWEGGGEIGSVEASILNLLPELQTAEILHSWKEMGKAVISEIQLTDMTGTSYISDFTWSR